MSKGTVLVVVGDEEYSRVFELDAEEAQYFTEVYERPDVWDSKKFWVAYACNLGGLDIEDAKVKWIRKYGRASSVG